MSSTSVSIARAPDEAPTAAALASAADTSGAPSYDVGRIVVGLTMQDGRITPIASVYGGPFFSFPQVEVAKLTTEPTGIAAFFIKNSWPATIDRHGNKTFCRPAALGAAKVTLPAGVAVVPPRNSFLGRILSKIKK